MKYVRMGSTGVQVSKLCLGCMSFGNKTGFTTEWGIDPAESINILRKAAGRYRRVDVGRIRGARCA